MSSDYGSDIHSDDFVSIDHMSAESAAIHKPVATPREPLRQRDVNILATPPPSSQVKHIHTSSERSSRTRVGTIGPRSPQASNRPSLPASYPTSITSAYDRVASHQNAPSMPQPLRTPMNAQRSPSYHDMFPSSQPSPSKKAIVPRRPQHLPQTQCSHSLASVQHLTQPISESAPLYRFPFGVHRGKTLLEVPENYIAFLRVDQIMADSMPGLDAALRLFDAGERPSAPLPAPTSSQQARAKPPPSTAPARMIATPGPSSTEPSPAISSSALQSEYRFDFGIHTGKTLDEVPLDYLDFLKKKGIVEGKPSLAMAVIRFERLHPPDAQTASQEDPASFTIKLGKHAGKRLDQVPADYLNWLRSSNFYYENLEMRRAFAYLDSNNSKAGRGASKKRKHTTGGPSTSRAGSAKKRRSTLPREMPEWFGEFLHRR